MNCKPIFYLMLTASVMASSSTTPAQKHAGDHPATVLHASRPLDLDAGSIVSPGEVLIEGERIVAAGSSVEHPVEGIIDYPAGVIFRPAKGGRGHPKRGLSAKMLAGQRHVCPYCRQQKTTRWWFTRARLCSVMA
jgi:hypothetical protein